jgi:hypothetical protein
MDKTAKKQEKKIKRKIKNTKKQNENQVSKIKASKRTAGDKKETVFNLQNTGVRKGWKIKVCRVVRRKKRSERKKEK